MKWSVFLLGGLAGAAAASYMAKKRPGMFAWATSAAGQAMTSASRKAMGAVVSRKFGGEMMSSSPKHSNAQAKDSSNSWGQIELMLNSDPGLKRQVDEIKAEAKTH
ncbi:hypothetical protein [Paenibacillus sacheonensis]|uniref:YtxH domain-containing protein n=1 Tax=Paenibacillus sacheonensis TaxID=742054 RepID=A0A7X5C134_9BACL|nr:hypothetical protein [Paenibacillus sacheonensis]MBM7564457.1 hypothetical protein [Paenibacillus sacheonensis]NBC69019.1 hypothetical protein [Paenibacillus sacheonensis]